MRLFIDPATGEARAPTESELAEQGAQRKSEGVASAKSQQPVAEILLPNGMTEVQVGRDAEVAEIACAHKDGSLGECPPEKAAELRAKAKNKTP